MPADCLFCRMATGASRRTVHADDLVFAIRDINPQAPTHVLVIPVAHVASAADLTAADAPLLGRLVEVAASIAAGGGLDGGWRLVTNVGADGGQSVAPPPRPPARRASDALAAGMSAAPTPTPPSGAAVRRCGSSRSPSVASRSPSGC